MEFRRVVHGITALIIMFLSPLGNTFIIIPTMTTPTLLFTTLALFSGFFSLGATAFNFLQKKTPVSRWMVLFLSSLEFILLGFWTAALPDNTFPLQGSLQPLFQLLGVVMVIAVVPGFTAALLSLETPPWFFLVGGIWTGLAALAGSAYLMFPKAGFLPLGVTGQMLVTIMGALAVLGVKIKHIKPRTLRLALLTFLAGSGVFVLLLLLDLSITLVPLPALASLDNLSLPIYLLALNWGSFVFAGKILNAPPLTEGSRITPTCKEEFSLSPRESELLEKLLEGLGNQEIADILFISRKTVENHLYNIFQKMEVKSRLQLTQKLQNWGSLTST